MALMIIRHRVKDFADWKKTFGTSPELKAAMRSAGMLDERTVLSGRRGA
jgi:hypothetical protein